MSLRIDAPVLPPLPIQDWDGGGSEWVVLGRAANDIEAHLMTGVLNEAGVETYMVKDRSTPGAWLHGGSDPWAPVTVYVRQLQYEDARIALAEVALEDEPASPTGERGSGLRRVVAWWVIAILLGLFFTFVGLSRTAEAIRACEFRSTCGAESQT
ncbi:MAG: DUF2007 domain-containing protein [Actinomycetota bacterium]